MTEELNQPTTQNKVVPTTTVTPEKTPDLIDKSYNVIREHVGAKTFDTKYNPETFRQKMASDFEFRKKSFAVLSEAIPEINKKYKTFVDYNFELPSIPGPTKPVATPGASDSNVEDVEATQKSITAGAATPASLSTTSTGLTNIATDDSNALKIKKTRAIQDQEVNRKVLAAKKTSSEELAGMDKDLLQSSLSLNSKLTAEVFIGKQAGKDAMTLGKYLMHLSNENPDLYADKAEKISKYGRTLSENERFDLINEANNYMAGKNKTDQEIYVAKGQDKRFENYKGITKKFQQLENEINALGDLDSLPDNKKLALKAKIDALQKQKSDFESDPENIKAIKEAENISNSQQDLIDTQNKLFKDSPNKLKEQLKKDKIKLQEAGIESGKPVLGGESYLENEVVGNVWNSVVDAGMHVLRLTKDVNDAALNTIGLNKGYSANDRLFDGLNSFVDSHIKATISDTDMFDKNGDLRSYRLLPNVAKTLSDMAITLSPVGRLTKMGQLAKIGAASEDVALMTSNFLTQYGNYVEDGLSQGMSEKESKVYGLAQGVVNSALQLISPNPEIRGVLPKETLIKMAKTYAERGAGTFTTREGFNKMVAEIKDITTKALKETIGENIQEYGENQTEKAINVVANAHDKHLKLSEEVSDKENKETLILTTLATLGAYGVSAKRNRDNELDGATYELVKNYDESQKLLTEMKDSGKMTDDDYNRISQQLEGVKETYDKIPENWSDSSKQNIMPLLREKVELEERVSRLDKSFSLRDNKRIDDINKTLGAFNEKESGIEAAAAIEGGEKTPSAKTENQAPEDHTQYEPLSNAEIKGLKNGSPVSLMEDGKKVDAKVSQIFPNGEIMLDIGAKKKIVLDSSLIKEKQLPKMAGELTLNEEELKTLQEENKPETKQQKESSSVPGSEGWNLAVKNRLEKVFKGSELSFNQEEFNAAVAASEHNNAANSTGFYDPKTNKIFLNPSKVKKDTPIHEFGHIWTDVLKEKNPEAYNKALQLAKQSDFYKAAESNSNYSHLSSDALAEEAFVSALGKKGVDVFSEVADKNAFSQFMTDIWDHIKDALGLNEFKVDGDMSFTDLVNKAAEDLSKNKTIELKPKEGDIKKQAFNDPVADVAEVAKEYAKEKGITGYDIPKKITQLDEENSKRISDAFSEMKHDPENPDVKAAYKKMADETVDQGKFILDKGYKVEIYEGQGEPYKNSKELLDDLRDNKHMFVLSTQKDFGTEPISEEQKKNNPLLADSGIKDSKGNDLLVNDVFRFVHDFFGHGKLGNQFGAVGEENAWRVHSKMYSDIAKKAMTTETRGQNSFVNFGPHMRSKEGKVIKKGEEGYLEPTKRPFAEQKIGLLPDFANETKDYSTELTPEEQKVQDDMHKDLTENYEARKEQYIKEHGLVFNTDDARSLSPAYNKNPELLSNATQIPAREFVNKMYQEELAKAAPEGKKNIVLMTAGGPGVGKSFLVNHLKTDAQMTVDTNLSIFERAKTDIDEAISHGKDVQIAFTYRDPTNAFISDKGGVIHRAKKIRRTVPFDIATFINEKSLQTIQKLAEHYKNNPKVDFHYFFNSFDQGTSKPITLEDVKKIQPDYKKAKEEIKNEIERQYKSGELNESQYAGLIGDTKRLQDILGKGGVEPQFRGGVDKSNERSSGGGEKFRFDPESEVGKKVRDFVKTNLDAGIKESDIKSYLKSKTKLSDDVIDEIVKSAKKHIESEPEVKTSVKKTQPVTEKKTQKQAPEKPKVKVEVKVNDKIVDLSRTPVNSRVNTVMSRIFNNPETPQTLKDELARRFGSKEQMLKSKRYSQKEARELGAEIVKAFDKLEDAIEFATNKGYQIDGDIQAAILDNVISDAYNAEKKAKTDEDREYYKGIQGKALDEIAAGGEQAGRKVSYYNMMYNVNPVIFGEKMAEAITDIQAKVLNKKLGDSAQNADEKIDQFAKESEDVVNREKKKAADSKKVNDAINGHQGPKYKGPKTTKTSAEVSAIRKSRSAMMDAIKKKLGGTTKGPDEKFAFDNETEKLDEERLSSIKQIGDTFIDEGYLTYNQWARKVQNEFKEAGIDIYGKELQEVWGRSNEKVNGSIKETYKNLPAEELESLIHSQAAEKIKEQSQAIKDILADTQVSPEMKDKIKNRLINELGLSEGYSKNITDSFMSEFETQARKQVESKLRQIKNRSLISSFNKQNKASEQKIVTDVLNGTFDGEKLKPSFYEAYGMTPAKVDQGLKDRLVELSRKVTLQDEGSTMKDKAMRDLYNEIQKHKPSGLFALGTDAYYSSMLSGYETHLKNFILYNMIQVYINKPLQHLVKKGGIDSKSYKAAYNKEIANFAFNEAKKIVLTGQNAFYDKPTEQSQLEKFTQSPGKNPLKVLWRYSKLPARALSAEDVFGTVSLNEQESRRLTYNKIKKGLEDAGEPINKDQINQEVDKQLGYTKENIAIAKLSAEQSLKNYYGEDFDLKNEITKKTKGHEEWVRQQRIKAEYVSEYNRKIINSRDQEIANRAIAWSKQSLLQNIPEGTMGKVYDVLNYALLKFPAGRTVMPFLKVPLNVANNLVQNSFPFSLVRIVSGKKGSFGGGVKMTSDEKAEHLQKSITYTLLTGSLFALMVGGDDDDGKMPEFYVTGKNGKSYAESEAMEKAGKSQPWTVYIHGIPVLKYQYTPFATWLSPLGIYNDMKLAGKDPLEDDSWVNSVVNYQLEFLSSVNEQASMKGPNELFKGMQDLEEARIKGDIDSRGAKIAEGLALKLAKIAKSGLVPNIATQLNTDIKGLLDQDKIATTSFADELIKDMPIADVVSQQFFGNESKIDVLGRPIKEKAGIAGWQKMGDDEYYRMFVEKHYLPFSYNKRIIKSQLEDPETGDMKTVEKPLSMDDRYRASKMRGDLLLQYMTENKDDLKEMTDEEFKSNLQSVISSYDKQVEQELFNTEDQ